jgi:UDP-glucose 4-epimerase
MSEAGGTAQGATSDRPVVLVTGAAGFLGSRVVALLGEDPRFDVLATDVMAGDRWGTAESARFVALDLRDSEALADATVGVTHVVHLAALRSKASQTGQRAGLDVNVGSTYSLLMLATQRGMRGFVYGSSQMVYGDFRDPLRWFTEDDARVAAGLSLYAAGKIASESYIEAFSAQFGLRYLALRFGGIYGPDAAPGSNSWTMLDVLAALDRGEQPAVTWSRETRQALIYVDDAARAVVRALDFPVSGTAVNVVDTPRTCDEIYSTLVRLYGGDPASLTWASRSRYQNVHGDRLVHELGCPPTTNLEAGLQHIIDWHRGDRGAN